ncbi:hypothetical protein tb265_39290 [Gemmatimonadetes bacterium T265]|nr:hypothetical protein tb265_39290 [Gemmatimonadetes bacterium T265]
MSSDAPAPDLSHLPIEARELLGDAPPSAPVDASPDAAGRAWARALGIYRGGALEGVLVGAASGARVPFTCSPTKG